MPIDTSLLPALELELEYARNYSPGGQAPNQERIQAIEEEIAKYRAAAGQPAPEAEATDESNEPTDYESTDKVDEKREKAVAKRKQAADKGEAETADATTEATETAEA